MKSRGENDFKATWKLNGKDLVLIVFSLIYAAMGWSNH